MSKETNATARPWYFHNGDIFARKPALMRGLAERSVTVARHCDKTVFDDKNISVEEMHANAALIVRAVNLFDAHEAVAEAAQSLSQCTNTTSSFFYERMQGLQTAIAALNKLKEEEL